MDLATEANRYADMTITFPLCDTYPSPIPPSPCKPSKTFFPVEV